MGALNEFLQTKGIYTLVMILFFLGVYGMVLSKKKLNGNIKYIYNNGSDFFIEIPVW